MAGAFSVSCPAIAFLVAAYDVGPEFQPCSCQRAPRSPWESGVCGLKGEHIHGAVAQVDRDFPDSLNRIRMEKDALVLCHFRCFFDGE